MHLIKVSTLMLCIGISLNQLQATQYDIPTSQKKVTCTINTLAQEKMSQLIGGFNAFYVATQTATTHYSGYSHSGSASTTFYERIDPFNDALKNYMAVEVTIKNSSSTEIYISKEKFFRNTAPFVSKEEIIDLLYPKLKESLNGRFWNDVIGGATLSGMGIFCALFGGVMYYESHYGTFSSDFFKNHRNAADWLFEIIPFVMGGACGLGALACFADAGVASKIFKISNIKEQDIQQSTFIEKNQSKLLYTPGTSVYKIPAKSEFHDLFFVDLRRVDRDFFSRVDLMLNIGEETDGASEK